MLGHLLQFLYIFIQCSRCFAFWDYLQIFSYASATCNSVLSLCNARYKLYYSILSASIYFIIYMNPLLSLLLFFATLRTALAWCLDTPSISVGQKATDLDYSPDMTKIVVGLQSRTVVYYADNRSRVCNYSHGTYNFKTVKFTPNSEAFVFVHDGDLVRIVDSQSCVLINSWTTGHVNIYDTDFSYDGTKLLTCGDDDIYHVWDVSGGMYSGTPPKVGGGFNVGTKIWSCKFSFDDYILLGLDNAKVRIYAPGLVEDQYLQNSHTISGKSQIVQFYYCTKDSYFMASDNTRAYTGEQLASFIQTAARITLATIDPTNSFIVLGNENFQLKFVYTSNKATRQEFTMANKIWSGAFSSDARMLAMSFQDNTVRFMRRCNCSSDTAAYNAAFCNTINIASCLLPPTPPPMNYTNQTNSTNSSNNTENMTDNSTLNVTDNSTLNVTDNSTLNITDNSTLNVTDNSTLNITDNSTLNITDNSTLNVTDNSTTNITDNSTLNITDNSTLNVTDNSTTNMTANTTNCTTFSNCSNTTNLTTPIVVPPLDNLSPQQFFETYFREDMLSSLIDYSTLQPQHSPYKLSFQVVTEYSDSCNQILTKITTNQSWCSSYVKAGWDKWVRVSHPGLTHVSAYCEDDKLVVLSSVIQNIKDAENVYVVLPKPELAYSTVNGQADWQNILTKLPAGMNSIHPLVYSPEQCKEKDQIHKLLSALYYMSCGAMLIGLFTNKIVGLQCFGVLQLSYFNLANHGVLNINLFSLTKFNIFNGINIKLEQDINKYLPTGIQMLGLQSSFLNNFNVMGAICIGLFILFFGIWVFLQATHFLRKVFAKILKQAAVTFAMFNAYNISYSAGVHLKYSHLAISPDWFHYLSTAIIILLFILFLGLLYALQFHPSNFGEFKSKFKDSSVTSLYITLSILLRLFIGLYISLENQYWQTTLFCLAAYIIWQLYFLTNLPFNDSLQNYRAGLVHFTSMTILIVSNYYGSMKINTQKQIRGKLHTAAIVQISFIAIVVIVSVIFIVWELAMSIRTYYIRYLRYRRIDNQKEKQKQNNSSQAHQTTIENMCNS